MNKFIINHGGYTFMRINKAKARWVYKSGKPIAVIPCNMHPFNLFSPAYITRVDQCEDETFERFVNAFEWYNCGIWECGKYAAFYIPVIETKNGYIYDDNYKGVRND